MINELKGVKEALDFYANCKSQNSWEEFHKDISDDGKLATKALATLDTLMARLESKELVEDVAKTLYNCASLKPAGIWERENSQIQGIFAEDAQAAINVITGKNG